VPVRPALHASKREAASARRHTVQSYDFRRPNKFSREHVRALQIVGETFARQFSTVLGTALRSISSVSLSSVDQLTYDDHVRSLSNPSYLAVLSLEPLAGPALFHTELPITMAMIERLLGGRGDTPTAQRPLTTIEEHLLRGVMERSLRELDYAFESLGPVETRIIQQESNPQFAQIAVPSDMTMVMQLDVKVGEHVGHSSLCFPFSSLQPVLETFASQSMFSDRDHGRQAEFARNLERAVHEVPVQVSVQFNPVRLRSADVVALSKGDVVPLRHPVTAPLILSVGDIPAFDATAGRSGKRRACVVVDRRSEAG
jgi:flagellar motor switch protein FliM